MYRWFSLAEAALTCCAESGNDKNWDTILFYSIRNYKKNDNWVKYIRGQKKMVADCENEKNKKTFELVNTVIPSRVWLTTINPIIFSFFFFLSLSYIQWQYTHVNGTQVLPLSTALLYHHPFNELFKTLHASRLSSMCRPSVVHYLLSTYSVFFFISLLQEVNNHLLFFSTAYNDELINEMPNKPL